MVPPTKLSHLKIFVAEIGGSSPDKTPAIQIASLSVIESSKAQDMLVVIRGLQLIEDAATVRHDWKELFQTSPIQKSGKSFSNKQASTMHSGAAEPRDRETATGA